MRLNWKYYFSLLLGSESEDEEEEKKLRLETFFANIFTQPAENYHHPPAGESFLQSSEKTEGRKSFPREKSIKWFLEELIKSTKLEFEEDSKVNGDGWSDSVFFFALRYSESNFNIE